MPTKKPAKQSTKKFKLNPKALSILQQVKQYITEEPLRCNMNRWGMKIKPEMIKNINLAQPRYPFPACGTIACVAGTVLIVTKRAKWKPSCYEEDGYYDLAVDVEVAAARILGLNTQQRKALFFVNESGVDESGWPKDFARRYNRAITAKQKAKVICERIDYFLKTGE